MTVFLQKIMLPVILIFTFTISSDAQNKSAEKDSFVFHLNTNQVSYFKIKPDPELNNRFKIPSNQLMRWSSYYLTPEQIEQRRRSNKKPDVLLFEDLGSYMGALICNKEQSGSIGQQVVADAVGTVVQGLIYGKPKKPAVIPKF